MVLYRKIFRYKGDNKEGDICSICLDKYEYWEKCASTTCNHKFHLKCFNSWFIEHIKKKLDELRDIKRKLESERLLNTDSSLKNREIKDIKKRLLSMTIKQKLLKKKEQKTLYRYGPILVAIFILNIISWKCMNLFI